eukprot:TRINITY_DN32349_c0_g2_i2.p1 TRINITY_DN32349_c0_g2~~TRINITY_DN32349_c0_g2_i2.p1  ORF type:complete len:219 (+),score=19.51 TRINITY_DN32349_c0_g2_i2:202-858(+)
MNTNFRIQNFVSSQFQLRHNLSKFSSFYNQKLSNNFVKFKQHKKFSVQCGGAIENGQNEENQEQNQNNGVSQQDEEQNNIVQLTQASLNQAVTAAYKEGYEQGYTEGIQVEVQVGVDHPWLKPKENEDSSKKSEIQEREQQQQDVNQLISTQKDSSLRSLVKATTYLGFSSIILILCFGTLQDKFAVDQILEQSLAQIAITLLIFYFHERIWQSIDLQ